MPKRRRHLPGKYKPKNEMPPIRNASGPAPLTVFQAEDGKWGVLDANGNVEIKPIYRRIDDHHYKFGSYAVILANYFEVLAVTPMTGMSSPTVLNKMLTYLST